MNAESNLIARLKRPKTREKAFLELLDTYQERLYWHIRKLVVTHENADDVLQNTFIRIYKGIQKFNGQSALHTWMYRIAYNESIRFLNKNRIDTNPLDETHDKYLEDLTQDLYFDGDAVALKLHKIISELTAKQQRVFQMKYFDDLSFREISKILGVGESTLKSSYYSAVKIIEEKITAVTTN